LQAKRPTHKSEEKLGAEAGKCRKNEGARRKQRGRRGKNARKRAVPVYSLRRSLVERVGAHKIAESESIVNTCMRRYSL
jgi:hypothetical protein